MLISTGVNAADDDDRSSCSDNDTGSIDDYNDNYFYINDGNNRKFSSRSIYHNFGSCCIGDNNIKLCTGSNHNNPAVCYNRCCFTVFLCANSVWCLDRGTFVASLQYRTNSIQLAI